MRQNQDLSEDFASVTPETTSNPSTFNPPVTGLTDLSYKLINASNATVDIVYTEAVDSIGTIKLGNELFIGLSVGFCALLVFQSTAVIIGIRVYKKRQKGG